MMTIIEPYGTMVLYIAGAITTLAVLMAGYKPQLWKVRLVPEHTVAPGHDILVPVGCEDNARRMRVVAMAGENDCLAIDIKDQQHHNGLAMGLAISWPIMVPLMIVVAVVSAIVSKAKATDVMHKPRARAEATHDVAECMRDMVTWR